MRKGFKKPKFATKNLKYFRPIWKWSYELFFSGLFWFLSCNYVDLSLYGFCFELETRFRCLRGMLNPRLPWTKFRNSVIGFAVDCSYWKKHNVFCVVFKVVAKIATVCFCEFQLSCYVSLSRFWRFIKLLFSKKFLKNFAMQSFFEELFALYRSFMSNTLNFLEWKWPW